MEEWKRSKKVNEAVKTVYLALSPLNVDRTGMAEWLGHGRSALPEAFEGKGFDDPLVKKAYVNYCRRAVDFFEPDYVAIGVEVNHLHHTAPEMWPGYVELHKYTYTELKKEYATLPLFTTLTIDSMLGLGAEDRAMLEAYKKLMPYNDIIGFSFYPHLRGMSDKVDYALSWLTRNFDEFGRPYAVAETGLQADTVRFKVGDQDITIEGSPEQQAAYYKKLLSLAKTREFDFFIPFFYKDYDARWRKSAGMLPPIWRDCGLIDENDFKRPSYHVWRKYFEMPLQPRRQ